MAILNIIMLEPTGGTELVIKVDILYFLGIVGTLIVIAWFTGWRFGKLHDSIEWIKRELTNLWEAIKGKEARRLGAEAPGSPTHPTELGWKYIRESGLDNIVDKEKREDLIEKLKNILGKEYADYDVQEQARRLLVSMKDDPAFKAVKDYGFNNGVDVDIILLLGGLLLRDNFLNQPHQTAPTPQERQ